MSTSPPAAHPAWRRRDGLACAALTLAWLAPVLFIGVGGDFPLNDDWAYAHSARSLWETGQLDRVGWTWAPIVTHSLLGAAFVGALGPSFEALRLCSLLLGWLGVLATYALCRELAVPRSLAGLGAASVGFNPLHLNLAYTFMTDVPFTALTAGSLYLLVRGLRRGRPACAVAGLGLALAAALSRQVGLALPAAFAAALLLARSGRLPRAAVAGGGLALAAAGYALASSGLFSAGDAGGDYPISRFLWDMLTRPDFASSSLENAAVAGLYLGLFAAPVSAALLPRAGWRVALGAAIATPLALQLAWQRGRPMPLGGNVLYDLGLGPATLAGAFDAVGRAPAWCWWGVTALALASAFTALGLIGLALARHSAELRRRPELLMLLALPPIHLLPQIASQNFFDRYLIALLPGLVALLLALPGRRGRGRSRPAVALGWGLCLAFAVFGTLGTRDYLEHHRARWRLIDGLLERGVAPARINGGFEFEGLNAPDPDVLGRFLSRRGIYEDEFVVSHEPAIRGYRVLATASFRRLLPPGTETLTLHRRLGPPRPEAGPR